MSLNLPTLNGSCVATQAQERTDQKDSEGEER